MRVLIDTSVLIRAVLRSTIPARAVDVLVAAAFAGAYTLLLPSPLLVELIEKVKSDPYLSRRITVERAQGLVAALSEIGVSLPPLATPLLPLTRDPKDDYLLAYAFRDRADFLVTGDRDLLDLAETISPPRIVDPGAFVRELRALGLL